MQYLIHGRLAAHQLFRFQYFQGHFAVLTHLGKAVGDLQALRLGQTLQILRVANVEVEVVVIHRLLPWLNIVRSRIVLAVELLCDAVGGVAGEPFGGPGTVGVGGI